ncbi:MAG: glycine cleavage T C-terminal barrel domain-containing protein [Chloroflexota bacterium]|nr:glycine cleavage T C-terminal barrel domain-containing protein [Chloroflexota bacterium]
MALQTGAVIFVDRHGFRLPAVYADFSSEYEAATTTAGVHDASYMGRLKATGEDGLDLLNRMSTNNVMDLRVGEGAVTILTTDRGRIIDVLGVVNQGDHVTLLTSPSRQQTVIEWLDKYTIMEDLTIENVTAETTMLALVGPDSETILGLTSSHGPQDSLTAHSVQLGEVDVLAIEQPLGTLSRYWLITSPDDATRLWQHLTEAGAVPLGWTAMEAARVNFGVPEFGPELGEPYNPLEAGLIGSVDFAKGCYIGQEVIARLDSYKKVQKYLVSLIFDAYATVSPGDELLQGGKQVGTVTSVAPEPSDGVLKGLGYVKAAAAIPGANLEVAGPEKGPAEILSLAQPYGPPKD